MIWIKYFRGKKQRIMRTIESLQENNMNGYLVKDKDELIDKIKEIVKEGSKVSCGGSMTYLKQEL